MTLWWTVLTNIVCKCLSPLQNPWARTEYYQYFSEMFLRNYDWMSNGCKLRSVYFSNVVLHLHIKQIKCNIFSWYLTSFTYGHLVSNLVAWNISWEDSWEILIILIPCLRAIHMDPTVIVSSALVNPISPVFPEFSYVCKIKWSAVSNLYICIYGMHAYG